MAQLANIRKLSQQPAALFDEVVVIAGRHTRLHLHPDTGNRYRSENKAFLNPSQSRRAPPENLPLVVDNPRFLILPWVEIPNLGSHILALVRRRLPGDWTTRYNTTPVLIEALASDCYSILRNSGLLGKVLKIRHLLEFGIFLPVPLHRARLA